jgi:deoxyribonuclease-4
MSPRGSKGHTPLGAHMSVAGGVSKGLERALSIEIDAVQIFTKNNNRWFEAPLRAEEIARFKALARQFERAHLFSHTAYLINLASPDRDTHKRSEDALYDELVRAEALGLLWVVLHPGSHVGRGESWGLKRIVDSLNRVLKRTDGFKAGILLETTAGQGSSLGCSFDHLAHIRKGVKPARRVGVCVDTCHIFAAGYDIRDLKCYRQTMKALDAKVGLKNVHALHLNDSLKPFDSHVDRHAHIGQGYIGLDGFACILNDTRLNHLPMVLETPKGREMTEDVENLNRLRKLVGTVRVRP